ncbi:ScyD/ScyE family protein [Streptomyces sp. NPDC049813]|uniref:ScyD/ScyE family protein n=1 Tax=Streptomyces sp. NPDC049813 TaxID=3365597 RepID=UPI0037B0D496
MPNSRKAWTKAALAAGLAAIAAAPLAAVPAQAAPARTHAAAEATVEVLASGLKNPRGVTALGDGTLLVAEAGDGSATCAAGTLCAGRSGSVYKVRGGFKGRVVTDLPSVAVGPAGPTSVAAGPNDVLPDPRGGYVVLNAFGSDGTNTLRASLGADARDLGTLLRTRDRKVLADLTDHETTQNPDGADVNSNPWGVVRSGSGYLATDAGGNSVLRVSGSGTTSTAFVLPTNTLPNGVVRQAVPSGIVKAHDGTVYFSDLGAIVPGLSRVWKVAPGGTPQVLATGLNGVADLAVTPDGNLLALSYTKGTPAPPLQPGALTKIDVTTGQTTEIPTGTLLNAPTGLAVGPHGQIYVTNNTLGSNGQLVRVRP